MEVLSQVIKLIFRIKYWLIFLPIIAALIAISQTRNMPRKFIVSTTIYTGVASGFTIESGLEGGKIDWSSVSNGMDNLITIVKSKTTLRNVSLRLYAQHMIYGDSLKDNNYIQASNYRQLVRITPKEVRNLIDKSSAEKTIQNLKNYEKASATNFVYGLFNWSHRHYSYTALSNIEVNRIFNSDMLDLKYSNDDPGITYNTLLILNEEFVKQYEILRFGETNNVVEYFRNELAILGHKLRASEDSLTQYNISKKVINYGEQTKQITSLARDYELMYYEVLLRYTSASASVKELGIRIEDQLKAIENNTQFLNKLNNISLLSSQIAKLETFKSDSAVTVSPIVESYKFKLKEAEKDLKLYTTNLSKQKYSKEGVVSSTFLEEWITELINKEKASAELLVMDDVKKTLESQYTYFSPIGSTLKRKEREIGFTEQSYLSVLQSLNAALMRQKTLQMSSASLKAINPPLFPVSPERTSRRMIVLATYFASLFFILTYFILIEIFDRTLRDKNRTERLVGAAVLGAFPKKNFFRYRGYNNQYKNIATNYLANSIVPYLNPKEGPDIINFISIDSGTGKTYLIETLCDYWRENGLRIKVFSWHDETINDSGDYILSSNLSDIYDFVDEDIVLVEHNSIQKSAIPVGLLREASLNLLILRADKAWRDIDVIAFERLKTQVKSTPLMLFLNQTSREATSSFVGLLPPYTRIRTLFYKLSQFGLTSK